MVGLLQVTCNTYRRHRLRKVIQNTITIIHKPNTINKYKNLLEKTL